MFKDIRLLLVNAYFPTDPKIFDFDTDELLLTINSINQVIEKHDCTDVIITGDFNCDFRRKTKFVEIVESFIVHRGLFKSWDKYEADFTHVVENKEKTFTSTLDHFFWNQNMNNKIIDAGVLHLVDNLSDHSPIYCTINVENRRIQSVKKSYHFLSHQKLTGRLQVMRIRLISLMGYQRNLID